MNKKKPLRSKSSGRARVIAVCQNEDAILAYKTNALNSAIAAFDTAARRLQTARTEYVSALNASTLCHQRYNVG